MEVNTGPRTWNQAFEDFPMVTTRNIEKQLRGNVARDKDKLRALVGGNYRDLLATAEQIIELDGQTNLAEAQISNLRQSCKPVQYASKHDPQVARRQSIIAELTLLQNCVAVIATHLKQGGLLLATRLLVIARLLHRSLGDAESPLKSLEPVRKKLASLRRQLLRLVDSQLADPRSTLQGLIEAACAYCLATSASSADAIQHFSHQRLAAIRQRLSEGQGNSNIVKQTFSYYVKSLQTTKALLGRQLPEALSQLQRQPILRDPAVRTNVSFDLGTMVQLISPEIYNFTPYIKRGDTSGDDADGVVRAWSSDAFDLVIQGIRKLLDVTIDLQEVLETRMTLLTTWLAVCFSVTAHAGVLEMLRKTFNQRINALIEHRTSTFVDLGDQLVASLPSNVAPHGVWGADLASMPVAKGNLGFPQQLRARHLGLTGGLRDNIRPLDDWAKSIQGMQAQISQIQQIRWQDKIEDADEEEEEEATTTTIIKTLSQEDPKSYTSHLDMSLTRSVADFEEKIREAVDHIDEASSHASALYILRAIREIQQRLAISFRGIDLSALQALVPSLQRKLAAEVVKRLSTTIEGKQKSVTRPDAAASVPSNLPSPRTFRTLHQLCSIMTDLGGIDVWTESAVSAVKEAAAARIFEKVCKSHYMRSQFDEVYLEAALGSQDKLENKAFNGNSEEGAKAVEYWARTKLLFGLLA